MLSTFYKRVACTCTVRSMSEYERVFGMFYFSANHTNSRSIKLKITGGEPLPYRKNVLHIQDRSIMDWILVRRQVTRRIIRIKICASVMELKTWWKYRLYFIYRNRIGTRGTENDFNSTRYYDCACFLLQTSKINKLIINIKCP